MTPVIADLRDRERLAAVLARHRPEIVFHAAAHKHVPLMEAQRGGCGHQQRVGHPPVWWTPAWRRGVSAFVLISTDKAVNPTSVMGATKRVAELIVQQAARAYAALLRGGALRQRAGQPGQRGALLPAADRRAAARSP